MATATAAVYTPFIENQIIGPQIDFDTDTIKVMLVTSGYTFSDAHEFRSSATAFETSGDEYTAGGLVIANVTISTVSNTTNIFGDDSIWASTLGSPFSFDAAIVYKDTGNAATDLLISFHNFGTTLDNNSATVTLEWSTNAIVAYTAVSVPNQLSDLDDVNTSTPTNRNVLVADGIDFESRLLVEADISDLGTYETADATILKDADIGVTVQAHDNVLDATTASFLTADETKLDAIEATADVTDTTNVTAAGALMDSEVDADIKTLALPASTTISAFGATLVDDAAATNARTTLELVIGTDVLGNVVEDTTPQLGGELDVNGNDITGLLFGIQFFLPTGADSTFTLDQFATNPYSIDTAHFQTASGTITCKVTIDGVDVTDLTAMSLSSTEGSNTATALNDVAAGNTVKLVFSSDSTAVDVSVKLNCTRA